MPVSVGNRRLVFAIDVAALLDGGEDGRIGGRPPDAVLFQRLHQAGLRVARRRLGEVLLGDQLDQLLVLAFGDPGRDALTSLLLLDFWSSSLASS